MAVDGVVIAVPSEHRSDTGSDDDGDGFANGVVVFDDSFEDGAGEMAIA